MRRRVWGHAHPSVCACVHTHAYVCACVYLCAYVHMNGPMYRSTDFEKMSWNPICARLCKSLLFWFPEMEMGQPSYVMELE